MNLNGSLPLKPYTLITISRVMSKTIRELEITDVSKFGDSKFAAMLEGLSGLNTLVLRSVSLSVLKSTSSFAITAIARKLDLRQRKLLGSIVKN